MTLTAQGINPIVLVALGTIEIGGKLVACAAGNVPGPDGQKSPTLANVLVTERGKRILDSASTSTKT